MWSYYTAVGTRQKGWQEMDRDDVWFHYEFYYGTRCRLCLPFLIVIPTMCGSSRPVYYPTWMATWSTSWSTIFVGVFFFFSACSACHISYVQFIGRHFNLLQAICMYTWRISPDKAYLSVHDSSCSYVAISICCRAYVASCTVAQIERTFDPKILVVEGLYFLFPYLFSIHAYAILGFQS
jgi:hypothetical protein